MSNFKWTFYTRGGRYVNYDYCAADGTMRQQWKHAVVIVCVVFIILNISIYSNTIAWRDLNMNNIIYEDSIKFRKLLEQDQFSEKFHPVGTKRRFPQCIIFGVRKCGTRALLEFIGLHPQVQNAEHEMHFFDEDEKYNLGLEWYRKHMPYSYPEQITVEKSPRYFITDKVPERISMMNSTIKLIVVLRNPTTRVLSDYTQVYYNKLAKGVTFQKIEELVIDPYTGEINTDYKAVRISIYHHHFERWLRVFKREQILIVDGDNLILDPVSEIKHVESFLGLEHRITQDNFYFNKTRGFFCKKQGSMEKCLGATKGRPHPGTHPSVIRKLNKFFKPHNEKLFKMINRTFKWS
ncbi:heparan sulfate glucosamine 3-O-sulfotransferase 1-like [Mytilus edulis]|uniref:Heparan sulfate glucosamine 3-O-sulfotransferase 5 n=1 Tax=Mytilus edulis TaxID=6550 RepID=A0A8S3QFR9_MYTED|nr:HS3ST5 [Mytilus edulis]